MNCILLGIEVHQLEKLAMKTHSRGKHTTLATNMKELTGLYCVTVFRNRKRTAGLSEDKLQSRAALSTAPRRINNVLFLLERRKHYSVPGQMTHEQSWSSSQHSGSHEYFGHPVWGEHAKKMRPHFYKTITPWIINTIKAKTHYKHGNMEGKKKH